MKTTMMGVGLCLVAASAAAQSVAGDWQGTLKFGPGELRLVLHITENGSELAGTIDSPDQNVKGIPVSVKGSDIDGDWEGTLAGMLRVVLHVTTYEDGLSATFDSPDQNVFGLPATSISRTGSALKFEMKQFAGEFSGTLNADRSVVDGTWSQLGNSTSLGLTRKKK